MEESRFRALFDATYPALARYARHRGLSGVDAEDLIASTLEVAWRRQDAVPEGDDALLWLYGVAHNQLRNFRRRQQRDIRLLARLPLPELVPAPREPSDFDNRAIRLALEQLSDDDRELLLLVAVDGLSPTQVAVVLECSGVVVRTRLHRARKRFGEFLSTQQEVSRLSQFRHEPLEEAIADTTVEASK